MNLRTIKFQNIAKEGCRVDIFFSGISSLIMGVRNNFILYLLLSIGCIFLPFFIFQWCGGKYVTFGNESLAYRYFTTFRLMSGESGYIWLPQGYFTLVLQKLILLGQNIFISPYKSFQVSLEWFSALTNIFQNFLAIALLVITFRDKYLTPLLRWTPLLFFFIVIYSTNEATQYIYNRNFTGLQYLLMPDYYHLDIVLIAACMCSYFFIATRTTDEISVYLVATIGLISGLAMVNKISLLFPVMAPVLLLVTKHVAQYKRLVVLLFTYISTAILGIILPLLFLYSNHNNISVDFIRWIAFISNPGEESNFLDNLKAIYLSGSSYFYFTLSYLCIWALAFITILKRDSIFSRNFLNALILFCLALLSVIIPLKVRSAGSTNFEAFCSITALTLMLIAIIPIQSLLYRFQWLILFFWWHLFSPIDGLHIVAHAGIDTKVKSNIVWAAHNALLSAKGESLMVLPDNSYGIGSVEELLLKGMSEFPTWNITTGKDLLSKFAPKLSIYSGNTMQKLKPSYSSIMWIDKKEERISLKRTYPLRNFRLSQNYHCKKWLFEGGSRIINVCSKRELTQENKKIQFSSSDRERTC